MNIALKCTFNDGGRAGANGVLGFAGTCSNENMRINVERGRVWCSQPENGCRKFVDRGFKGPRPESPCYESRLFLDWKFATGVYHSGRRRGEIDKPRNVERGDLALLTTRRPDSDESSRLIIGVMRIQGLEEHGDSYWLMGDPRNSLRVPEDALLPYWRFRKGIQIWGTHLYRYVEDEEVTTYLSELLPMLKRPADRSVAERLLGLAKEAGRLQLPPPVEIELEDPDEPQVAGELTRKYGSGGESEAHRKLKRFIFENPQHLGLEVARKWEEFRFESGDRVDLMFETTSGDIVPVEIELEGEDNTRVGAFQAIKYRALAAATNRLPLESPSARGVLVAHRVPESVKRFCHAYGIEVFEFGRELLG
ncbi:hypothetical protein [Archangium violaceum]|uniref:hypothetical protein n=1 Tax=Archangium violaceum TaxID=83451 RepID=UPI0036D9F3B4